MKTSDSVVELYSAFVKFQAEIKQPKKNAMNPFYKNMYTTLDEIIKTVNPILTKHGLAFLQDVSSEGESVSITTRVIHSSGEWIETEPMTLRTEKSTPQGQGSATSYGRRYSLSAILGISSEDDDDGNNAEHEDKKATKKVNEGLSEAQVKRLFAIAHSAGYTSEQVKKQLIKVFNKEKVEDLTKKEYDKVCTGYEKAKKENIKD